jgi:uncharacterized protein (DUF924 family)
MAYREVLDFWFLTPGSEGYGQPRKVWFIKDAAFDATIGERFGTTISHALEGGLREWDHNGAHGVLARILVLDQFTRNAFRDRPESFAGDALALTAACALVDSGADRGLNPLERWFAYLPFEHAEQAAMQERSLTLFTELARDNPGFDGALDYARRHRDVIGRYGRFPHRNAILGRASSADELDYLSRPGAGF